MIFLPLVMDLAEQAIKIWPNINKALEKSKKIRIVQTMEDVYLAYEISVAAINQTDLPLIIEYLRSKDAQIYWQIIEENLDTPFYGQSLNESSNIKNIVKLATNGDNLIIEQIKDLVAEHLEDLLEAFREVRFTSITINMELDIEDLQVIRDATHATIYYGEKGTVKLFEPEN